MPIEWTSALETGLRQIDLQHQELVELINEAADAHAEERDREMLERILPKLSAYVLFHFGTEESLLAGPGILANHASAHRRAHREFTARVQQLRQASGAGDPNALPELVGYLQQWLVEHILVTDKELGRQVLAAPGPRR